MFLPRHCAVCRVVGSALCPSCAARLVPAPAAPPGAGLARVEALFGYEGAGRAVIAALKFANHRDALVPLAAMLAAAIDEPVDLVTWVPTSAARRRRRGYDQGELLARAVARSLGAPAAPTLRRVGGGSQAGLDRSARLTAEFVASQRASPAHTVALVDDVRTTGASLSAGATALRRVGVERVVGATLAATPGSVPLLRGNPLQSS